MILTIRILALAFLILGAVEAIRRAGFSRRDRKHLVIILAACTVLVLGTIAIVLYLNPETAR